MASCAHVRNDTKHVRTKKERHVRRAHQRQERPHKRPQAICRIGALSKTEPGISGKIHAVRRARGKTGPPQSTTEQISRPRTVMTFPRKLPGSHLCSISSWETEADSTDTKQKTGKRGHSSRKGRLENEIVIGMGCERLPSIG
eukprot:2110057-Rhodomonas_salina.1